MVMDRKEEPFQELLGKIRFKPDHGRKKKFKPRDILAYGRGNEHFISIWIYSEMIRFVNRYYSVPGKGEQHFVKVIHRGHLNYYHWEYEDGEFNHIDFVPLFKKENRPDMVRVTQGVLGLKKKRLAEYFEDCPELVRAVQRRMITTPQDVIDFHQSCR
jgi:hypothetical protein